MRRLIALAVAAVVVIVFGIGQLVLPGIAADNVRSRLSHSGHVLSVHVSAFPAIELLWHQADTVTVRMASYRSTPAELGKLIAETAGAGSLDASTTTLDTGLITLHDARMRKRGNTLTGTATVTAADLANAVPFVQNVVPVASGDGKLTFQGSVFGVAVDATVEAVNGQLVVRPDVPLLNLVTVTVFSDPHIAVQGVGAHDVPGGFALDATARLR